MASGFEAMNAMLAKMGQEAERIAKAALYEGAGVAADNYKRSAASIRTETTDEAWGTESRPRLAWPSEKAALMSSTGIAKFRSEGGAEINTVVGVGVGYAPIRGKMKAKKMIANAINHGTSFMIKQPVFRGAASKSRKAVEETMVRTAEKMMNEIVK